MGYDWDEEGLPKIRELQVKSRNYRVRDVVPEADVVSVTLPAFVCGISFAKPRITPHNVELSLCKRLYHKTPTPDHRIFAGLRGFVRKWVRRNLKPLSDLMTFEEWIEETNYSSKRKQHFRELYEKSTPRDVFKAKVKCFVKDEFYPKPKAPRMISSREDVAKCYLGPIFASIEKVVYELPYFVKHLTAEQRVRRIHEVFGLDDVYVTDYTAFETHFHSKMMWNVEMQVYDYLLRDFPEAKELVRVILGKNKLRSKYFTGTLEAVRMSGEMNTSLGNGISNLLFMLYAAECNGVDVERIIVEGDDGLVKLSQPIDPEFFKKMGLEIKMAKAKPYNASFCGCVYNPETLTNFGHPIDLLAKIGWAPRKALNISARRKRELLISKVYSACAEHAGVPIVWKFCELVLRHEGRITFARALKYLDRWRTVENSLSDQVKPPSPEDRLYFAEVYEYQPDAQIRIEEDFERTYPACYSELLLQGDFECNWAKYVS